MNLVYKLLRQQLNGGQLSGFLVANLIGMLIVLLSIQLWFDLQPFFSGKDRLVRKDFLVVTKRIFAFSMLSGRSTTFTPEEIRTIEEQSFTQKTARFTASRFQTTAGIGLEKFGIGFTTDMFFESVPDDYLDVETEQWNFEEGQTVIPIILPRNYLNLYNYGFAQSRNLPKLSEGAIGMLRLDIRIQGNGLQQKFEGKIVGFSDRLNTILVPEAFMNWANTTFAAEKNNGTSRLIVETTRPGDKELVRFFQSKGYEIEEGKLASGQMMWFLNILIAIVTGIGLLICILSFYILILSIYLLVQKNADKMENLTLLGYAPEKLARPYELLAAMVNGGVVVLACFFVWGIREYYLPVLKELPAADSEGEIWPAGAGGIILFGIVFLVNRWVIRRKIRKISL